MAQPLRRFLRDFTAMAVKEHLRSQLDGTAGSPRLTRREVELVRFVRDRAAEWDAVLAGSAATPAIRHTGSDRGGTTG